MVKREKTQPNSPAARLEYAIHLAKSGQREAARDLLRQIVALQPVNQAAWLWLSAVALQKEEAQAALDQARKINPSHSAIPQAEQWLVRRFSPKPKTKVTPIVVPPEPVQPVAPSVRATNNQLWIFNRVAVGVLLVAMLIGLMILGIGIFIEINGTAQASESQAVVFKDVAEATDNSQLDQAWAAQAWPEVITILEEQRRLWPNSAEILAQSAQAHANYGVSLRHQALIKAAQGEFERALALDSENALAEQELELTSNYLAGKKHFQKGEWSDALIKLKIVHEETPAYTNVQDLMFSAYFNQGLQLQATNRLLEAQEALQAAIALRPDLTEPRMRLAEVEFALAPETPPTVPIPLVPIEERIVVVGIAEQRMQVYEADRLVYDFVVSTGEPGRDTAIGEFEIQNKIDVAYASTWNLDMPHWLGIYWAGPLQNGIHSLPTIKHTGQTLWDGYLGQRVSYGCVILGHGDSETLYNWAEVGTKVKIVPSIEAWLAERS